MNAPVFYDASGRRRRWSIRARAALMALLVGAAGVFALTLIEVPTPRSVIETERPSPRPLAEQVSRLGHKIVNLRKWLPAVQPGHAAPPTRVGFYVPWDDASRISLTHHINELDWVVPALLTVTGKDHRLARGWAGASWNGVAGSPFSARPSASAYCPWPREKPGSPSKV